MSASMSTSMSSYTDADTDVLRADTLLLTADDDGCDDDKLDVQFYTTSQTTDSVSVITDRR